jgi:hypothetical protein
MSARQALNPHWRHGTRLESLGARLLRLAKPASLGAVDRLPRPGALRVHAELKTAGIAIGRNESLECRDNRCQPTQKRTGYHAAGLRSSSRRRSRSPQRPDRAAKRTVDGQCHLPATLSGFLYLVVVLDS